MEPQGAGDTPEYPGARHGGEALLGEVSQRAYRSFEIFSFKYLEFCGHDLKYIVIHYAPIATYNLMIQFYPSYYFRFLNVIFFK